MTYRPEHDRNVRGYEDSMERNFMRFPSGRYYDNEFSHLDINDRPIFAWLSYPIPMSEFNIPTIFDMIEWCKNNLDNMWEGPVGYFGVWKFRFTTEEDFVAFKLRWSGVDAV